MVYNNTCVKDPFRVQERPMGFNITEYREFNDIDSHCTLQLTYRKLPPVKLALYQRKISAVFWKVIKTFLPLKLHIFVRPDFLYILHPK